jgi:hypothetical protein
MILIFLIGLIRVLQRYPSYVFRKNQTDELEDAIINGRKTPVAGTNNKRIDSPLTLLLDLPLHVKEKLHRRRRSQRDHEAKQELEITLLECIQSKSPQESSISMIYTNYTHEHYASIFEDMSTPQGKAFYWLLHVDEYIRGKRQPSHAAILQRYVLTLLFFATEGEYNYRLGSQFTPDANTKAKWSRIGPVGFLSKHENECHWNKRIKKGSYMLGVVCDTSSGFSGIRKSRTTSSSSSSSFWQVKEIHLQGLSLDGFIPEELGLLTGLKKLVLNDNYLKGTIPRSLGALTHLELLDLSGNQFMGSIPPELGSLVHLKSLFLHSNHVHGSTMPSEICNLVQVGNLMDVWTDCRHDVDPIFCNCCTKCF